MSESVADLGARDTSLDNRLQAFLGANLLPGLWPDGFGVNATWTVNQWNTLVDIPVGAGVFHGATLGMLDNTQTGLMEIRITIDDYPPYTVSYDAPVTLTNKCFHVGLPCFDNATVTCISGPDAVRQNIGIPFNSRLKVEIKSAAQRHPADKSYAFFVLNDSPSIIDAPWNT